MTGKGRKKSTIVERSIRLRDLMAESSREEMWNHLYQIITQLKFREERYDKPK